MFCNWCVSSSHYIHHGIKFPQCQVSGLRAIHWQSHAFLRGLFKKLKSDPITYSCKHNPETPQSLASTTDSVLLPVFLLTVSKKEAPTKHFRERMFPTTKLGPPLICAFVNSLENWRTPQGPSSRVRYHQTIPERGSTHTVTINTGILVQKICRLGQRPWEEIFLLFPADSAGCSQ